MRRLSLLLLGCLCSSNADFEVRRKLRIQHLTTQEIGRTTLLNAEQMRYLQAPSRFLLPRGGQQEMPASTETDSSSSNTANADGTSNILDMGPALQGQAKQRLQDVLGSFSKYKTKENMTLIRQRLESRLQRIRSSAKKFFQDNQDGTGSHKVERLVAAFGSSLMTFWANPGAKSDSILSFPTLYALSLLGSSVGYYCFLYFITLGYALGITVPMVAALVVYTQKQQSMNLQVPPEWNGVSTLLHSLLVVTWGIRAFLFYFWREYFNWPDLHKQIRHVNENNAPTLPVKCLIWVIYSFLYTAMLSPCWLRLEQSTRLMVPLGKIISAPKSVFNPFRATCMYLPILMQILGLMLETVADFQKSTFKQHNRYEWCHVGLWKWSTHPNYLGELIFWTGTYLGWILFTAAVSLFSTSAHTMATLPSFLPWLGQLSIATLGYGFITTVLGGSIRSMSNKHIQKYGHLPEYASFRQTHGVWGPKWKGQSTSTNQTMAEVANAVEQPLKV
jgi:steroid 5-alpha reductase family enzyme